MRVVHWNCNNGMGSAEQIAFFKSLEPDIAILPELKFANISLLSPSSWSWVTNNHVNPRPKGLGILGFGETSVTELSRDEDMELFLPVRVANQEASFNLVAVWNFYSACKQGRFKGVRDDGAVEYSAIRKYAGSLGAPCIFGGDWNYGPTFSQHAFKKTCDLFSSFGFVSLYHKHHGLDLSESKHRTFKSPSGHHHHLDHLFCTSELAACMVSYDIIPLMNAVRSDHSPIVVTFNFGKG